MSIIRTTAFFAFLIALFVAVPFAQAMVVNVEPDAFPSGTVINNSYPGATLSVEGSGANVQSLTSALTTTGSRVFGSVGLHPVDDRFWDEGTGFFRADFSAPASFVSIDVIFDDDDWGTLQAYNSSGVLLQQLLIFSDVPGSQTLSISRGSADIAYILAGSPATVLGQSTGDSVLLDNLVANVVPIPAALPLFASALIVFGMVARQRRR